MNSTAKVARNSAWLIAQPLLLNVLSLAVTGWIARTLGKEDYGIFVYAFSFALMFMPVTNLGLRVLTVRRIAERPENPELVLGKIFVLRILLTFFTYGLIVVIANLLKYDEVTRYTIYLAGLVVFPSSLTQTAEDTFEAFEEMKYVAYAKSTGGIVLTALSIVVLLLGLRLYALVGAFVFGQTVGFILALHLLFKHFIKPQLAVDLREWRALLAKGAVFFYPGFVYELAKRLGLVILRGYGGNAAVGVFGAASELVQRLVVIPEGMCGALFPTLIAVYQRSEAEAILLFRRFYTYALIIALPIAVGGNIVAPQIIRLIYGPDFGWAVPVFQIMLWWLVLNFLVSMISWTFGAIHREKRGAAAVLVTTPVFLIAAWLVIPIGQHVALAAAIVLKDTLTFILVAALLGPVFTRRLVEPSIFFRIVLANLAMAGAVWGLQRVLGQGLWTLTMTLPAGGIVYVIAIFLFRAVTKSDIKELIAIKRGELEEAELERSRG